MKKIPDLHLRAVEASSNFKRSEIFLLKVIQQVDEAKVFLEMGYSNLFSYLTESLKLTEAQAFTYSTVSRKSRQIPSLQTAIEAGLSLTKAQRIVPILTKENHQEWISKAQNLSKYDLEREVAGLNPSASKKESLRAISKNRLSLKIEISHELNQKLQRLKTLISNQTKKNVSLEGSLEEIANFYLSRKDPLKKASLKAAAAALGSAKLNVDRAVKNVDEKKSNHSNSHSHSHSHSNSHSQSHPKNITPTFPGKVNGNPRVLKRQIPAATKHQVFSRDQMCCSFKGLDGKICGSERSLEIHHLKPWSFGGDHSLSNLKSLCHAHHRYGHGRP